MNAAIINMVSAVALLDSGNSVAATVDCDDSIIEDSNATIDKNIKLVNAGLRSKITAIMEIDKCSEEEAQKELERIAGDNKITGQDIDWTDMGNGDNPNEKGKDDVDDEPSCC